MPSDAAGGGSRGRGLNEYEKKLVITDRHRKSAATAPVDTAARSVVADKSTTVLGYARTLRGLSIEHVAKKTVLPVATLHRIENGGGVALLSDYEKAKIEKVFHRSADDLAQRLTPETKAAILHGAPMPPKNGVK
jgi:ribosome-binding protein aMBF1 (putative translation factor)